MSATRTVLKRVLTGRPPRHREVGYQLMPRWVALGMLAANPLSSVVYAVGGGAVVLAAAGQDALRLVPAVAGAVALLLAAVVAGERHVLRAEAHDGALFTAVHGVFGPRAARLAAASLLVSLVLTVAVSLAAAAAVLAPAVPAGAGRAGIGVGLIAVVTALHLRSASLPGWALALPAYAFAVVGLALAVVGGARCASGGCPQSVVDAAPGGDQALTSLTVLGALALTAAALTGYGMLAGAVTAQRYPQARNAGWAIVVTGATAAGLLAAVGALATATGAVAAGDPVAVVTETARAVFGGGAGLGVVRATTALVLVAAASSAYTELPRLVAALARRRWLPRHFVARGDRLLFGDGMLVLSLAAAGLILAVAGRVQGLLALYVVAALSGLGVSLAAVALRLRREHPPGWRWASAVSAAAAAGCSLAVAVAVVTGFTGGTWVVVAAVPLVAGGMGWIERHYRESGLLLRRDVDRLAERREHHAVILLDRVDEAAARALSYVLVTAAGSVRAIGVASPGADLARRWAELAPNVPLEILEPDAGGDVVATLDRALGSEHSRHGLEAFTTAVVPEELSRGWWQQLREHRLALGLKARLAKSGLVVADVTSPQGGPGPYTVEEPAQHHVVVLVSAVHAATVRAIDYARGLQPTSLRALSVSLEPERSMRIIGEWQDWAVDIPVEVIDSPFRSLAATVRAYVRDFAPDGRHTIVTCVLPEIIVGAWYQRPLHNQSAELLKASLLFERGVVTTSVPYRLPGRAASASGPG